MLKMSAGILLYRFGQHKLEVLLAHPGGPFWAKKDLQSWSIPKGEFDEPEEPLQAALREMEEETGLQPSGLFLELTPVKTKSGKKVFAWAVEGDADPALLRSNSFEMEWPPRSGQKKSFPEIDRIRWFTIAEAEKKILEAQRPFLAELMELLNEIDSHPH